MFKPELIAEVAERLERSASSIMVVWSILGLFAWGGTFAILSRYTEAAFALAFVPAIICVAIGEGKAKELRYRAQIIRLNLQIELNTRMTFQAIEALAIEALGKK